MRSLKFLVMLMAIFVTQIALADTTPGNTPSPFGDLQAQIDALTARTQALEGSAPNSNIDDRTYCFILDMQIMRARPGNQTEETQNNIIRRVVRFENGVLTGDLLSNTLNNHSDVGTVTHTPNIPSPDPLVANYLQMGTRVDITFNTGMTTNWHVSKDGSLIVGSMISNNVIGNGVLTLGVVRNWTLVEIDPLDSCDAEDQ